MEGKKAASSSFCREVRCPVHNKLIGRYDTRYGVRNVTYWCPRCKAEHCFTIPAEGAKSKPD